MVLSFKDLQELFSGMFGDALKPIPIQNEIDLVCNRMVGLLRQLETMELTWDKNGMKMEVRMKNHNDRTENKEKRKSAKHTKNRKS